MLSLSLSVHLLLWAALIPIAGAESGRNAERPGSANGGNLVTQGPFEIGHGRYAVDGRHMGALSLMVRKYRTLGSGTRPA